MKELYHRKDLGSKVEMANQAYVSLFERMLAEVLLLQRSKFNVRDYDIQWAASLADNLWRLV